MFTLNVNIGEVTLGKAKDQLITILGSCVALILWHPQQRLGMIGHILIPSRPHFSKADPALDGRFADECWQIMQHKLQELGILPDECQYHLVGGSQVFNQQIFNIGRSNLLHIQALLKKSGLQADTTHTGAFGTRMLKFHSGTGNLTVKHHADAVCLS